MNQTLPSALAQPTERQIQALQRLGVTDIPTTRSEASKIMTLAIAQRDMRPATDPQKGRAGALGGRDLPGAGVRELSTQIALLEVIALIDATPEDNPEYADYVQLLVTRVRERFFKPITVSVEKAIPQLEPALI